MMPAADGRNGDPTRRRRTGGGRHVGPRDDDGARRCGEEGALARADATALLVLGRLVMVPAMVAGRASLVCRRAELGPAGMDRLQRDSPEAGRPGQEEQRDEWQAAKAREHRGNLAVATRRG